MSLSRRTPVIVGVGQVTNRPPDIVEPLDLMEEATRLAAQDAGAPVLDRIDSVQVVHVLSWTYPDPAGSLAGRLGLADGERLSTTIGGNTPQWLLARACDRIAAGEHDAALIVGAEALESVRQAGRQGIDLPRGDRGAPSNATIVGDDRSGIGPAEMTAGVMAPAMLYPLFESAIAARAGRSPDEQRAWLGRVMAPFTEVAARHPDLAWFAHRRSPDDIAIVTPDNRLVSEPYTKRMNAIIQVDQGAAVLVLAAETAEAAGVPRDRWVFPWAAAECNDVFLPSERPDLSRSPAIAAAGSAALAAAGIGIDDVAAIDLYSCFPCAVEMAAEALGIDVSDRRGLTITGGHPYFGGPGNNYTTHALALAVQRCRDDPTALALVTGLGWYVTKHAVGIYGASPPPEGWRHADCSADQARIDASSVTVDLAAEGTATVEAMTVGHDRSLGPTTAPLFGRLPDGRRIVATPADDHLPAELSGTSLVGREVEVSQREGTPVYTPR